MAQEYSEQFQAMDPPHDPVAASKAFRKAYKALKAGDIIVIKLPDEVQSQSPS
jgi:formylmethanofuran dehydrogenase subunit A